MIPAGPCSTQKHNVRLGIDFEPMVCRAGVPFAAQWIDPVCQRSATTTTGAPDVY